MAGELVKFADDLAIIIFQTPLIFCHLHFPKNQFLTHKKPKYLQYFTSPS